METDTCKLENMDGQLQRDIVAAGKIYRQMELTMAPLEADLYFAVNCMQGDGQSQFWRRTVIRCFFAVVESLLWNMKHIVPKLATISGVTLSADDLETANEERVKTTANGKSERHPKFLRFRDNVKATFALFGKVHGVRITINYDSGFDAFCATYDLRSRLMHPKRPFDPGVSDPEIATSQIGVGWFIHSYQRVLKECGEAVPKIVKANRLSR